MRTDSSPSLRKALKAEQPLQIVGAINAYSAIMAERAGFRAVYLSGSGVATASYGVPDLGITTLPDVLEDTRRITGAVSLPLLVDVDTGWGSVFNIARAVRELIRAGASGMHIEDQVATKRCGHRPNKAVVEPEEMADRIRAAVDARGESEFMIMARTDAFAGEGIDAAIERALRYKEAGADALFPEALHDLEHYRRFAEDTGLPVLANLTEFGETPLFELHELGEAGVAMVLYPLSAFRAMNAAALEVYATIRKDGTQRAVVHRMQTRAELYEIIGYHDHEEKLDQLMAEEARDDSE